MEPRRRQGREELHFQKVFPLFDDVKRAGALFGGGCFCGGFGASFSCITDFVWPELNISIGKVRKRPAPGSARGGAPATARNRPKLEIPGQICYGATFPFEMGIRVRLARNRS